MGLINLTNYIVQRIRKPKNSELKVSMPGYTHPLYLRNTPSDTQIFTQIFLREELKFKLDHIPETIIDGGANIGMATTYLHNRYPAAKIFSIEPDSSNFELLKKNTKHFPSIICYNNAIWNKSTFLQIINADAGNESFIVNEIDGLSTDSLLKGITLGEIIDEHNLATIDLVKLDIEGSETEVFKTGFCGWLNKVNNLLVETHNWINPASESTVLEAMQKFRFVGMQGEYHFFTKARVK